MTNLGQDELREINALKQNTAEMFQQAQVMFHTIFDGLMENDIDILNQVLKDETKITGVYNNLTALAIEASKQKLSAKAKKQVLRLVDIISFIEEIADSCVNMVQQIEYKIREKLLFSEPAVEEYKDLHNKVEETLSDTIKLLESEDPSLAKKILKSKPSLDALVDKYRLNHIERSAKGICCEWARIRYLEMLNIAQAIAYHCMEIAEKIKGK